MPLPRPGRARVRLAADFLLLVATLPRGLSLVYVQLAVTPPSIVQQAPFTGSASSEHRYITSFATLVISQEFEACCMGGPEGRPLANSAKKSHLHGHGNLQVEYITPRPASLMPFAKAVCMLVFMPPRHKALQRIPLLW